MGKLFEEEIFQNIEKQIQVNNIVLTEKQKLYIKKISIFTTESRVFLMYAAGLPYMQKSIRVMEGNNNVKSNPFFQIMVTLENTLFNNFILSFANLFTLNTTSDDTFSIRTMFRTIGEKRNKHTVLNDDFNNIINNGKKTKIELEKILGFFDNKENKNKIKDFVKFRNKIIAHPTIERDYRVLGANLNIFIEFFIPLNNKLYEMIGIYNNIDFNKFYEEQVNNWGFYYETIKKNLDKLTSDDVTNKIIDAFEQMKKAMKK